MKNNWKTISTKNIADEFEYVTIEKLKEWIEENNENNLNENNFQFVFVLETRFDVNMYNQESEYIDVEIHLQVYEEPVKENKRDIYREAAMAKAEYKDQKRALKAFNKSG